MPIPEHPARYAWSGTPRTSIGTLPCTEGVNKMGNFLQKLNTPFIKWVSGIGLIILIIEILMWTGVIR